MKMKKMVGAFALTAALAMGTAPAFAAGASVGSGVDEFSDNGSTEIKAVVDNVNPQVRATVPLQVTVVFGSTGQGRILGPSASAYAIKNVGDGNIKVADAEITLPESAADTFTITQQRADEMGDGTLSDANYLMFYYTTAENNTHLTTDHKLSQAVSGVQGNRYIANAKAFTEETIVPRGSLEITLGGLYSFNSTISNDDLTDTLCSIKYTIAAAA